LVVSLKGKNYKQKIISVLVSLFFLPLVIVGQIVGLILGKLLYFIYQFMMFIPFFTFMTELAPYVISGVAAGYFSAFIIFKIYKDYNVFFTMIIPSFLTVIVFYYAFSQIGLNGWSYKGIQDLVQIIFTTGCFYYFLNERDFA